MIGIIGAMAHEVEVLKESMTINEVETRCGIEFYTGYIGNNEVTLTGCGVGKVNAAIAAAILVDVYQCNLVINTGIAGGIKGLNTSDVCIATKLYYSDVDVTVFGYSKGQIPGLPKYFSVNCDVLVAVKKVLNQLGITYNETTIYTGDQFASSTDILDGFELVDEHIACEMGGAAIAHVCVKSGVNFLVLRYISDIVGKESQIEDYNSFEYEMANRSSEICFKLLNNL